MNLYGSLTSSLMFFVFFSVCGRLRLPRETLPRSERRNGSAELDGGSAGSEPKVFSQVDTVRFAAPKTLFVEKQNEVNYKHLQTSTNIYKYHHIHH